MNRSTNPRFARLALSILAGAAFLPGCYAPGGSGFSTDTHTYVSTAWQPYTVTLKDTRTGKDFWSIDVPVGKQLVLNFRDGDGIAKSGTPDLMEWEIMDAGEMFGQLDNSIPVPPAPGRRLDPTIRATPELPESMGGGIPKPTASAGGNR